MIKNECAEVVSLLLVHDMDQAQKTLYSTLSLSETLHSCFVLLQFMVNTVIAKN